MRLLLIIKSTAFQTGCPDTWGPLLAEVDVEFNEDGSCEKGDDVVDEKWWDRFEERKKFEDLEYETADEGEDEVDGYETAAKEEFLDCCEEQKERQEEVNEENGGTRMSKQETQEPRFFMMSDVRENSYYIKGRFDRAEHMMLLDTGCSHSVMPYQDCLNNWQLSATQGFLADGSGINIQGMAGLKMRIGSNHLFTTSR